MLEIPAITKPESIQFDFMSKSKLDEMQIQIKESIIVNTIFVSNDNFLAFSNI